MREIKFRFYDAAHGMVYDPAFGGLGDGSQVRLNELLATPPQITIMQYTGLKDKNGKEIYEGDIVSAPLFSRKLLRVEWKDAALILIGEDEGGINVFSFATPNVAKEVIGNICENPELLEAKQ